MVNQVQPRQSSKSENLNANRAAFYNDSPSNWNENGSVEESFRIRGYKSVDIDYFQESEEEVFYEFEDNFGNYSKFSLFTRSDLMLLIFRFRILHR